MRQGTAGGGSTARARGRLVPTTILESSPYHDINEDGEGMNSRTKQIQTGSSATVLMGSGMAERTSGSIKTTEKERNNLLSELHDQHKVKTPPLKLLDLQATESIFMSCTLAALSTYIFLLSFGYTMIPSENLVYMHGAEQQVAATAAIVFVVSILLTLIPLWFRKQPISSVVLCGLIIQSVALCTNLLLAFAPTIILRDPITHARVFYVRWCEW